MLKVTTNDLPLLQSPSSIKPMSILKTPTARGKEETKDDIEHSKQAAVIMGYTDDIEQGTNNLRKAHPQVKHIMGSYQVRRRLSLAGIGMALFGAIAVVTFVTMHMNGKSSKCHLCWSREKAHKVDFKSMQMIRETQHNKHVAIQTQPI